MTKIEYIGKCVFVESVGKKILVIGDMHLGYEEALNRAGIIINNGLFEEVIRYLDAVFKTVKEVDEVVLLGDVKHSIGTILKQERKEIIKIINFISNKLGDKGRIVVIKGNHDAILEPILRGKERVELVECYVFGGVCFTHGDRDMKEIWGKEVKLVVIGHVHPAVRLNDGVKSEKFKCFLKGNLSNGMKQCRVLIVPSFLEQEGDLDVTSGKLELPWKIEINKLRVFIVLDDNLKVLDFGKLGEINDYSFFS